MGENAEAELSVAMFTPWRTHCGIRDYSAHLLNGLHALPGIAAHVVEAPHDVVRPGLLPALRAYREDERHFAALGRKMNVMSLHGADQIGHIQHQYFFFGGVAPYKSHVRAFLRSVRIPLILTAHEIAQAKGSVAQRYMVRVANRMNFIHPAIRCLIVHTQADRETMLRLGAPPEQVRVIRHAVPPALPLPDPQEAKRAWNLEHRRVLTLFGFLSGKKGHRVALEAMPLLPSDVVLLFAGDQHPDDHTGYVPDLRAEIVRRNLADRVRITGYLAGDEIPQIMALTDAAIAPFLHSSGSGSLANLFAYGRAIVASDIEPHREVLSECPHAMCQFPSGSSDDLARAVLQILEGTEKREGLQRAAREYAACHTYLEMARQTAAVYREYASH